MVSDRTIGLARKVAEAQEARARAGKCKDLATFSFNGAAIHNPFMDESGTKPVDPVAYYGESFFNSFFCRTAVLELFMEYGFEMRGSEDGVFLWREAEDEGYTLTVTGATRADIPSDVEGPAYVVLSHPDEPGVDQEFDTCDAAIIDLLKDELI